MMTALVTGGSRGIGYETARQLAQRGFHVWIASRQEGSGTIAAKNLRDEGLQVSFVELDVGAPDSVRTAFQSLSRAVDHLDVLINNAAVLLDEHGDLLHAAPETIEETIRTNTIGPLLVIQTFAPLLRRESRVVNVSSQAGEISTGMGTYAPLYSISKAALNAVTCQTAHALKGKRIAVNAVCPGWVRTQMGGRIAPRSATKGAETIVWLATESPVTETGKFWKDKKPIPW